MNHHCAHCNRHDLPESAFDFTATGRRRKHCHACCTANPSLGRTAHFRQPRVEMIYVRGAGLVEVLNNA